MIIDAETQHTNTQKQSKYTVCNLACFIQTKLPEQEWLLYPVISKKGTAMISAGTGVGKTFLALTIALAVSTGTSFLKFKADRAYKVVYIDGEMNGKELQERIQKLSSGLNLNPNNNHNLDIWTSDLQEDFCMPNLTKPEGQKLITNYLETRNPDLLIFDNLSVLCNGIRENDAEAWANFQDWLLVLRRKGYSVLEIQHNGKNGDYRGSSKQQDILNYAINLKRPDEYKKSDGARFEIHFGKTRGVCGDDVSPFEAKLVTNENNSSLHWEINDIHSTQQEKRQNEINRAHDLRSQGKTQQEIAGILNISVGKTNGLLKAPVK